MQRIEAAATAALAARAGVRAPGIEGPVDLEVDRLRPVMTELAGLIPGVEQRWPRTLGFRVDEFAAACDLIEVFTVLASAG